MAGSPSNRVISQIGDSTDDDDDATDDSQILQKLNSYNFDTIEHNGSIFTINVSCVLKAMGLLILNSSDVKREYKNIKQGFVPPDKKQKFEELDEEIGPGWGSLLDVFYSHYRFADERMIGLENYYRRNREKIDNKFRWIRYYNKVLQTEFEKGEYYFERVINRDWYHSQIQELHRSIERDPNYTENERIYTENYKTSRDNTKRFKLNKNRNDAVLFLARVKGSMKLDKDVIKNILYESRRAYREFESGKKGAKFPEPRDYTYEELKIIYPKGQFSHFVKSSDTSKVYKYEGIGKNDDKEGWLKIFPSKNLLLAILQDKFGENDDEIKNNPDLKLFVELVFGVEVKRNPAALLTNAMFLDLLYGGRYGVGDFPTKLPVAFSGAVNAATTIDVVANFKLFDYRSKALATKPEWYKACGEETLGKVYELVKRDENIFTDWIGYVLNTRGARYHTIMRNEVSGEVFLDLIKDWYGIEISGLRNGTIRFRF